MNNTLYLVLVFVMGLVLGTFFFGGLWLTVKLAVKSKYPSLLFMLSSAFRIVVTLFGFYLITKGGLPNIVICMSGFVVARFVIMLSLIHI